MNGSELLRIVDAIHRDKGIDKEIVFEGITQAILSAARKHFGEESEIEIQIDRDSGHPSVRCDGVDLETDEIGDLLGRIAAQTAKQVMIQKIREAERDALFEEYTQMRGQIVTGNITRLDGGTATVSLGKVEGILPRREQIPGEMHRVGERIRLVVLEVRKVGSRVRIILSRTHPELVRRLFEVEIPEVAEHVIDVRSLAREAGYRSKVAVSSIDSKIDCVGACVGVRGARIKGIVDELAGERIDIVRWNDSLQVLVPNSLQPAEVEDVILCPMLGKVIVLVHDDQLSLAIGKKGQNVRLASKLVGWDIHVMTQEKLGEQLGIAMAAFSSIPEVSDELAESLVEQGFFTFDDLSVIEPDQLAELGGLTSEECDVIVEFADKESARIEAEEIREKEEARARRKYEATHPPAKEIAEIAESESESKTETGESTGSEQVKPDSDDDKGETQSEADEQDSAEINTGSVPQESTTDTDELQESTSLQSEIAPALEESSTEINTEGKGEDEEQVALEVPFDATASTEPREAQQEEADPGEVESSGSQEEIDPNQSSIDEDGGEQLSKAEASTADE
ncbi:MAG: transcription termination factor NusA [Planctomycetes bacterium]|nr:transcription termination factor NusA [Planctomycetota bacterium]